MSKWQRREDGRMLTLIAVSAVAGTILGSRLLLPARPFEEPRRMRVAVERELARPDWLLPQPSPLSADPGGRLYGRVLTRDGRAHEGFLRWDRNEASWADVLDAHKEDGTRSGVRFGHVQRLEIVGRSGAALTLRSGQVLRMSSGTTDLGRSLRALEVEDPQGRTAELAWGDLLAVEFYLPAGGVASSERLHGTVTTRGGLSFTGWVAWDTDEVLASDVLDGDDERGVRVRIPFGSVARVAPRGARAAEVALHTGERMVLRGTNDVDRSMRGVAVSDPSLGEVKLGWDELVEVRFHPPAAWGPYRFDGGQRLRGTVRTTSGEALTGELRWDRDETHGWEMLNGTSRGVELQVEFGEVARIVRWRGGVTAELRDGRSFDMTGSNDVGGGHRGVTVETAAGRVHLEWSEVAEVTLEGSGT